MARGGGPLPSVARARSSVGLDAGMVTDLPSGLTRGPVRVTKTGSARVESGPRVKPEGSAVHVGPRAPPCEHSSPGLTD